MKVINQISKKATIGPGTKVWHWAIILDDVRVGSNCSIGSCVELGRGTVVGDETRIGYASFFPPNSVIGSRVFVGPGVVCCDDKFPRVNNPGYEAHPPVIEDGASIGAGSVLLPGVRIGAGAMVGAGSVVTRNVKPHSVVRGKRAREIRYL